jgi:cell division septum initiation protein DivIVA
MARDLLGSTSGDATFRTRLMGFDKEEVRACLRNLVSDYEEAQKQINRLTVKLQARDDAPDRAPLPGSIAVQVEKVLASAHRVADEVRVDAEHAAKKVLGEAQEESVRMRGQAEADASALVKTAEARVAELNLEIERMLERRAAVHAQLHRAADQLDELSRGLRAARLAPEAASPARKPQAAGAHEVASGVAQSGVEALGGRESGHRIGIPPEWFPK